MKRNCWELKSCGREQGGPKVQELGECPAATSIAFNGTNGGTNAGRCCWPVEGTLCENEIQGDFSDKITLCAKCEVFRTIKSEEGSGLQMNVR